MILLTHENQWRGGRTAVAFGMFDGVHEGHAQLMRTANTLAALEDVASVVYTFSSHPMATYAPQSVPPQIHTRSEKIRAIARMGVDVAVLRLSQLSGEARPGESARLYLNGQLAGIGRIGPDGLRFDAMLLS